MLVLKFLLNYTIDRIGNVLTNWIFKVSILHSRSIDSELKKIRCFNCILFDETNYISRCQALCKCYKFNCCMGSSLSIGISLSLIAKNKDKLNIFQNGLQWNMYFKIPMDHWLLNLNRYR